MAGIFYPNNQGYPQTDEQSRGRVPFQQKHTTVGATSNNPPITFPEPSIPNIIQGNRPRSRSSHGPDTRSYQNPSPMPPLPSLPYQPINHQQQRPPVPPLPPFLQTRHNGQTPNSPHSAYPSQPAQTQNSPLSAYPSEPTTHMGSPGAPPIEHVGLQRSKSVPAPPALPPKNFEPSPSAPPLPPKIPLYPEFMPSTASTPSPSSSQLSAMKLVHQSPQNVPSLPSYPTEKGEHLVQPSIHVQESSSSSPEMSEQDELALALELSAKESQVHNSKLAEQEEEDFARAMEESMRLKTAEMTIQVPPYSHSNSPQQLAAGLAGSPSGRAPSNSFDTSWNVPSPKGRMLPMSRIADDEAFARRLAEEDGVQTTDHETTAESSPPLYNEVVAPKTDNTAGAASLSVIDVVVLPDSFIRRGSSTSALASASESEAQQSSSFRTDEKRRLSLVESAVSADSTSSSQSMPPEVPAPGQFVDKSLLEGISFGFNAPHITSIATSLRGSIPNVISLPDGKRPPFHFQAPSWRHMLKLMARLSSTRIEASLEAVAASKAELKLRTVVQFVRATANSQDWKMILYLTIDLSPPVGTVGMTKFVNGDVNVLPWSYAQSPPHTTLYSGPDSLLSKYYTIPPTTATPYPTLPINFPNMAMYLTSAMEDSRRMHDSSLGMRRLAKMVDTFYPAEQVPGFEGSEPEKVGVGRKFRNMFRSGKQSSTRRNEETWDLVTPFVADEY